VTIGTGTAAVRAPRVNDKRVEEETGQRKRVQFEDPGGVRAPVAEGQRRAPGLYLRGLSTGDSGPALEQRLGEDAAGLSPSTISRL
jgi:putative transposase